MPPRKKHHNLRPRKKQRRDQDEDAPLEALGTIKIHPLLQGLNTPEIPVSSVQNPRLSVKLRPGVSREDLNPYFDPVAAKGPDNPRKRKALVFNEKGKYVAMADKLRQKLAEEKEKLEEHRKKEQLGLTPRESLGEDEYKLSMPPDMEWWDMDLFPRGMKYLELETVLNAEDGPVSLHVQHPALIAPPYAKHVIPPRPLYLTKKEMKRIRKKRRAEETLEKQEKIKLGIEPPPPPKVRLVNLPNVLTNEMIKDPTAVERKVREEMEQRRQQHEKTNQERALTSEERVAKMEAKIARDVQQQGIYAAVFRISNLQGQKKYKVDINAKELKINGVCLSVKDGITLVVAEGLRLGVSKYSHVVLDRVTWGENECERIWEGQIREFHFLRWSAHVVESESAAVLFLVKYNATHFWRAISRSS